MSNVQLKNLMKQKRSERAEQTKINSPLARYNNLKQLVCAVCKVVIKADSLWEAHCLGASHKSKIVLLKEAQSKKRKRDDECPTEDTLHNHTEKKEKREEGIDTTLSAGEEIKGSQIEESTEKQSNSQLTQNTTHPTTTTSQEQQELPTTTPSPSPAPSSTTSTSITATSSTNTASTSSSTTPHKPTSTVATTSTTSSSNSNDFALPSNFFDDPNTQAQYEKFRNIIPTGAVGGGELSNYEQTEEELTLKELMESNKKTQSEQLSFVVVEDIIIDENPEENMDKPKSKETPTTTTTTTRSNSSSNSSNNSINSGSQNTMIDSKLSNNAIVTGSDIDNVDNENIVNYEQLLSSMDDNQKRHRKAFSVLQELKEKASKIKNQPPINTQKPSENRSTRDMNVFTNSTEAAEDDEEDEDDMVDWRSKKC